MLEIGRGQSGVDFRHIAHMGRFVEDSGGYVLPGRSLTAPGVESRSLIGLLPRLPSPTEQSPSGAAGAKSMHNRYHHTRRRGVLRCRYSRQTRWRQIPAEFG